MGIDFGKQGGLGIPRNRLESQLDSYNKELNTIICGSGTLSHKQRARVRELQTKLLPNTRRALNQQRAR